MAHLKTCRDPGRSALFGCAVVVAALWLPSIAIGQDGEATVTVTARLADRLASGTTLHIAPSSGNEPTHSITITSATPIAMLRLSSGWYEANAQSGSAVASTRFYCAPGARLRVTAWMESAGAARRPRVDVYQQEPSGAGAPYSGTALQDIPTGPAVSSLLDTSHPFLIADRIDNGGLWGAEPARLSGHGSSWTQTTYRLAGADITDPVSGGTPVVHFDLRETDAVVVTSLDMPVDIGGPGSVITLVPRQASRRWSAAVDGALMPTTLQSTRLGPAPPVARLDSWGDAGADASGPAGSGGRGAIFVAGRALRTRRVERGALNTLAGDVGSLFVDLHAAHGVADRFTLLSAIDHTTLPFSGRSRFANRNLETTTSAVVVHSEWARSGHGHAATIGGTYERLTASPRVASDEPGGTIERLTDGPPLSLTNDGRTGVHHWSVNARVDPETRRWNGHEHVISAGLILSGSRAATDPVAQPPFAELVNGLPSHVWDVSATGTSRRRILETSGWLNDDISILPSVTVRAGARIEHLQGSAEGATASIGWLNVSPRFSAAWRPADGPITVTSAYGWYRHRLPLTKLAVGDPAGARGIMYRWDDVNADGRFTETELTAVASVGLGAPLGAIDPDLRRPLTREFVIGIEGGIGRWRVSVLGTDRRERHGLTVVNVGVTSEDYTVSHVLDPGIDLASTPQPLAVFNRSVASFGRDAYLLTNDEGMGSSHESVNITARGPLGGRGELRIGAEAFFSKGIGANRGYRVDENDQGLLGEVFVDPNAATFARGWLFFDRSYVIKIAGGYRLPGRVHLGVVSRYHDGQPFARVVILPSLNQGVEAVAPYPRGGQRFTSVLTTDARFTRQWTSARRTLETSVDVYNLFDAVREVEEDVVTGPAFRAITAVQPPRAVKVALRVIF